jgi:hypothetical protein
MKKNIFKMKSPTAILFLGVLLVASLLMVGCSFGNNAALSPPGDNVSDASLYTGFKLEVALDINAVDALNTAFIHPLYLINSAWSYDWLSPTAIKADDLLMACGMENYLGLERGSDSRYVNPNVAAETVEDVLFRHFGVASDYLRTSPFYNEADNTYLLIDGRGGGWNATALSAKQEGNTLTIEVGLERPDTGQQLQEGDIRLEKSSGSAILSPQGTLIVELTDGYFKYVSYALYNAAASPAN